MPGLLRRLLVAALAFVPVVWGNCPYRILDGGAPAAGHVRHCPCCKPVDLPTRPPCDDECPLTIAKRGSMPASAPVTLPAPDLGGFAVAACAAAPPPSNACPEAQGLARSPGPPLDLLATVVLIV